MKGWEKKRKRKKLLFVIIWCQQPDGSAMPRPAGLERRLAPYCSQYGLHHLTALSKAFVRCCGSFVR